MEFGFDVASALQAVATEVQQNDCMVIHGDKFRGAAPQVMEQVRQVVDSMGHASGKAQKLPSTITTLGKLQANGHILFIKAQGNRAIGFIKVGYKKLFVRGRGGEMHEMKPLSVLDFYVDSSVQRGGIGRKLFDIMLAYTGSKPALIAYDRPSHKLMGFLAKHFNLRSYVQQNNNYVVFDDYFSAAGSAETVNANGRSDAQHRQTAYDNQSSVFGQSHMSSFQRGQPVNSVSQNQTLSGGWAPQGITNDANSQQRTHYPRQSHHNQQFRIGLQDSSKRHTEKPQQVPNQGHMRTQANTFGMNSNSIASGASQMFEQTHSSNGFGSTFLSSQGNNVRASQQMLLPNRQVNSKTSTQMKFGNVGQELLGGQQSRHERDTQATLNDFKQSFTKLSFQQRNHGQPQQLPEKPESMFQTSYQNQFQDVDHQKQGQGQHGGTRLPDHHHHTSTNTRALLSHQALGQKAQPGYSHFQAFANRQQSLPSPAQQQTSSYNDARKAGQSNEFRPFNNIGRPAKLQHAATFQLGSTAATQDHQQILNSPHQAYMGAPSPSKAYSMPATQRMVPQGGSHRANTQQMPSTLTSSTLSPVMNGSRAAQFLQHQHQFQSGSYPSVGALGKPTSGPLASVWQSQDQSSGLYRDVGNFLASNASHQQRGLRF